MRLRVFRLLVEGRSVKEAARRLGVSKQAIYEHAATLVRLKALHRVSPPHAPIVFESGPAAEDFWRQVALGRGRSPAPRPPIRIHHGWKRWSIASGGTSEPLWERQWDANGVHNRAIHWTFGGRAWYIRESRGPERAALAIAPPEEYVYRGEDVARVRAERNRQSAQVLRAFAKQFGYGLEGAMQGASKHEYALPLPRGSAEREGTPGEGVWIDESEGTNPEIEWNDDNESLTATVLDLPDTLQKIKRQLKSTSEESKDAAGALLRLVEMHGQFLEEHEAFLRQHNELVRAQARWFEHLVPKPPSTPPDNREDVA